MQTQIKARIFLFFAAPLLAEVLSGNSPILNLLLNPVVLILQLLSYGLPVLLIREFALRHKLGLKGIFILGLAYGILNEGLLAKTFFHSKGLLVADGYGFVGGINTAWALYICVWHALFAVTFPIVLTNWMFLESKGISFLKLKIQKWFFAFIFCLSALLYFIPKTTPPGYFIFYWTLIVFLVFLARTQKGEIIFTPFSASKLKIFIFGFCNIIFLFLVNSLSKKGVSLPVYIFSFSLLFFLGSWYLKRENILSQPPLTVFALGGYTAYALFAMFTARPDAILLNSVLIFWFVKVIRKIKPYSHV